MGKNVLYFSRYTVSRVLRKQIVILIYPYPPMDTVLLGRHSSILEIFSFDYCNFLNSPIDKVA
jgi:hypothetical protein